MSLLSLFNRNPDRIQVRNVAGGIKPTANKASSLRSRIMSTPIPKILVLPLLQHKGTPANPIVKLGDRVLKGQKIAEAADASSAPVHAPTSGKITEIDLHTLPDESGTLATCITLASDGNDQAIENTFESNFQNMSASELLQRIRDAGIVGMGGAGFPTYLKIQSSTEHPAEILIINAVECEPYITADEALIREHACDVVTGAKVLKRVTGAKQCIVAIGDSKTDAITELKLAISNSVIQIAIIPEKYTAGSEKQLIYAVTGREVPSGKYPASIGVSLHNTGTAFAIYKAICEAEPCISRITTVTGSTLKTPKNFHALIGTPVDFLFNLCGIDETRLSKIIVGGPLMGSCLTDITAPIIKTTNCLIAGSAEEFPEPQSEQACIRCGFCADVCPVNLLPQQLYTSSRCQDHQQAENSGLFDCIECGACSYVCPSHIPLVQYYRASKSVIDQQRTSRHNADKWQARFQFHQYRHKREKEQKSLKSSTIEPQPKTEYSRQVEFSREKARLEISEAVARVKARRSKFIATSSTATEREEKP